MFPLINVGTTKSPKLLPRRDIRVTFGNKRVIETWINGTEAEILRYYHGVFNLGRGEHDDCQLVTRVEFLDVEIPVGVAI